MFNGAKSGFLCLLGGVLGEIGSVSSLLCRARYFHRRRRQFIGRAGNLQGLSTLSVENGRGGQRIARNLLANSCHLGSQLLNSLNHAVNLLKELNKCEI